MRTVTCVARAYLLAGLSIAVALLFTARAEARDYDAVCMDVAVPEGVLADEVFAVTITVENTGTEPWEGWPIRLRSVNPQNNQVWGTDYILIAQGSVVQPGTQYVFRSHLRHRTTRVPPAFNGRCARTSRAGSAMSRPSARSRCSPDLPARPPVLRP